MEQPANQPAPQVVNLETQVPVVVNANTPLAQPPKQNSKLLLILLAIFAIIGVSVISYFLIWKAPLTSVSPALMEQELNKAAVPEQQTTQTEPPPVSNSDSIDAIEQDLENTTVPDDSILYTDIKTDLNQL